MKKFNSETFATILGVICVALFVASLTCGVVAMRKVFAAEAEPIIEDSSVVEEIIIPIEEEIIEEEIIETPPTYKENKLLSSCGFTVEELKERLRYPLNEYAEHFIKAEEETGVNAVFLSAVAALESGWGKSRVAKNRNNLYGWTTNSGSFMRFESKEACISFIATKFKELYLSPDGRYFKGYDVEDVNHYYNGRKVWAERVRNIMVMIGGDMYEG